MATTGHESEAITVGGLKASLQKLKTDKIDPKSDKTATVSTVAYDATNKKITKTINGTTTDVVSVSTIKTDLSLTKSDVGLGNVTNDAQIPATEKGVANGVATLDESGIIPSEQLPSFVDDVIDLLAITDTAPATCAKDDLYFNTTTKKVVRATAANTWGTSAATNTDPEKGKIYLNLTNEKCYRWSGSAMAEISSSDVTGIKMGSNSASQTPSQGVVTLPVASPSSSGTGGTDGVLSAQDKEKLDGIETGADVTDATNVKAALGTVTTSQGKYLKDDGTWDTPQDTTYVFNTAYDATTNKAATMADIPSSLPASDVYSWAKAENKPSYTLSEVGASVSVSAISSNTSSSCSITGSENSGKTQTIIYTNAGSSDLSVSLPTASGYLLPKGVDNVTCPAGGYCEVNYINVSGTIYIRAL